MSDDASDWEGLAPELDALCALDAAERESRLVELTRSRPDLAAELRRLLAGAEEADGRLLSRSPLELAGLLDGLESDERIADLAGSPVPSRIGERVGPFVIREELGRGGMGTVYAAERIDGSFEQRVAIKILKRGLDSDEIVHRFLAERSILARLEHPRIARLLDGGVTVDGLPWFAMERVDGLPVTQFARAHALDLASRLRLFLDVCDGVAAAHRSLVVHRDLKPSNVFASPLPPGSAADGALRWEVKLLDFGIAKMLADDLGERTRTELRPMTPLYAAPEQLTGGPISTLTDVFQLGRLLEELLLGKPADWPRDVERIVARARHEDPARRYGSVDALSDDVQRFLDGRPVAARGDSTAYRLSRFVRRHRLAVAAAAMVLVALVAGLTVALWQAAVARREAHRARVARDFLTSTFESAGPEVGRGIGTTADEILELGVARIETDLAGDREMQAEMYETVAGIEHELGAFARSAELWERALAASVDVGARARARTGLSNALVEFGELERGEAAAREAYDGARRELGERAPETWMALHALGGAHRRQRKLAEAESEQRNAVAAARAAVGEDDERVTTILDALANALFDQARYPEAETIFREVLARAERTRGPQSLAAAQAWHDLGAVLDEAEENSASEEAYLKSLAIFRARVKPDHPALARALKNLGGLYDSMGRPDDARKYLGESLAIVERTLGADSYDALNAVNTLAVIDYRLADYTGAEAKLRRVLTGFRTRLGPANPDTLSVQSNLAAVLGELGRLDEAEAVQRDVVAQRRSSDPNGADGKLLVSIQILGSILLRAGRIDEAIEAYDDSLARRRVLRGNDSVDLVLSLEAGARARLQRGRPEDLAAARVQIDECLRLITLHPDGSPGVRADVFVLAARRDLMDRRPAEALSRLDEALAIRTAASGATHWKSGEVHLQRGRALALLGRPEEARQEVERAVAILAASRGRELLLAEARQTLASLPLRGR
jgi:eukaryotic-like serine/threonine-protein kinase